jgi:type II secretory pathway predicted ATPase ExeA
MYEAFYRLSANPFRLTPDPKFCFSHSGYKLARDYLKYALKLGEGFIMITGQPGTGKTTLAETFLKGIEVSQVAAQRIAASNLGADDLLRTVAYSYGIEVEGLDKATLRRRIQQFFAQQVRSGRRVLLIIDEAQGLPQAALEELRLLADLQSGSRPLLQLFLVGQDKLQDLMSQPDMEPFQQRVIASYHLVPLGLRETRDYVEYRLRKAGWRGDPELTGAAMLSIYQTSKGVPRHINKICNRLLLLGFGKGKHRLDKEDMQAISAELREEQLTPMGGDPAVSGDTTDHRVVPELQDGSLSLADLALKLDKQEMERLATPVTPEPALPPEPALTPESALERRTADRRIALPEPGPRQVTAQARRVERPARPRVDWWSAVSRLGTALRQYYVTAMARMFASRSPLKVERAVPVAALFVATISIAAFIRFHGEDASDQSVLSVENPLPIRAMLTYTEEHELPDGVNSKPGRREPVPQDAVAAIPVRPPAGHTVASNRHHEELNAAPDRDAIDAIDAIQQHSERLMLAYLSPVEPDLVMSQGRIVTDVEANSNNFVDMQDDTTLPVITEALVTIDPVELPPVIREAVEPAPVVRAVEPAPVVRAVKPAPVEEIEVPPPAVSRKEKKIAELLSLGSQALDKYRLRTPVQDNAYDYYQKVLRLDPGNRDALEGMENIVERYTALIRRAIQRQDNVRAHRYITRGLQVQPGNRHLLALQDSMKVPDVSVETGTRASRGLKRDMPGEKMAPRPVSRR